MYTRRSYTLYDVVNGQFETKCGGKIIPREAEQIIAFNKKYENVNINLHFRCIS